MQRQIGDLLTKESGSVRADARTKTLIVTDVPDNMQRIESMVKLFDRRPRQVFIEAKIVEVALDDRFSLGVNWSQFLEGLQPRFALQAASQPGLVAGPVGRLTFNTIVAGQDLELVVEALKDFADTKILSNPQIAVVDGQEALIEVVENQPYKEIKMEAGTTNVTGVSYKFEKVGVQLAVTPRITDEEMISVAIKPEISSISTWYDGPPQQATPVIRKAVAETSVLVKNGVTIIIGGMITDRKDRTTRTVPLLGSVPLLGRFFRNDGVSARNSEIVVFLTPRVITGEEMFPRVRDMSKEPKPLREVGAGARKEPKPVR
jgi:type IV pilus assembly protein PilQ